MKLRAYQSGDLPAILNLFRDTVHTVCARDYTRAQLDAWAPAELDAAAETSEHCAMCDDYEPHTDGRCTACGHRASIA